MSAVRPKIILDTNVFINAATGSSSPEEWKRVETTVRRRFEYFISWVTWKELLIKLARGGTAFWEKNRQPLKFLRELSEPADTVYLDKPHAFVVKHVLALDVTPKYDGNGTPLRTPPIQQMKDVLHAIEVARSKESLRNGVVIRNKMTDRRWRVCFDLDHLDTYENQAQQKLAQQLQDVREGRREPVDLGTMACRLLDDLEFRPTAEDVRRWH